MDSPPQASSGSRAKPIFVTGATGYIGGRLVPRLIEAGYRVRCLARSPRKLQARAWSGDPRVEIVAGDVADTARLATAMAGCGATYYLVHSMLAAGSEYAARDLQLVRSFAAAAERAGCDRIIYLGGLGETGSGLSEHLRSRLEVGEEMASGAVPTTIFRAAMIIGSGSASFEILRYLVERLPVMVTPRWVSTECQPIAVRNMLHYMIAALEVSETLSQTFDVGGPEILSYREMMKIMARELGLPRRLVIPVPVLTPRLSSLWIHLVTPLTRHIARPLAEGLKNRVVCRDDRALRLMPQRLLSVQEAIEYAIGRVERGQVETSWSDAGPIPGDPDWAGGTSFTDRREATVRGSREQVFRAICRIGGGNGWYAADILWRLRGLLDRMVGGPGLRRGRRNPETIGYGDALDFWRVTGIERDRWLELRAEMKLPGEALLEFAVEALESDSATCRVRQTARFLPRGLMGILYWYAVLPFHNIVFRGMLHGIRRTAESMAGDPVAPTEPVRDPSAAERTPQ